MFEDIMLFAVLFLDSDCRPSGCNWNVQVDSDSSSYMRTRKREKRIRRNQRSAVNEETSTNRLLTRALYDSETEVGACYKCFVNVS